MQVEGLCEGTEDKQEQCKAMSIWESEEDEEDAGARWAVYMYGVAVERGGMVPPLEGMQGKLSLTITNRGLRRTTRQVKSPPGALTCSVRQG